MQPGESYPSTSWPGGCWEFASSASVSVSPLQLPGKLVSDTMSLFPPQRMSHGGGTKQVLNTAAGAEFHSAGSDLSVQVLLRPADWPNTHAEELPPSIYGCVHHLGVQEGRVAGIHMPSWVSVNSTCSILFTELRTFVSGKMYR